MTGDASKRGPDDALGRIFRNARALVGGKGFAGLLSLAYLAIAARSLGPHDMGVLVLAHAYAMTIAGIARFQSWQAVIRFGTPMIGANDRVAFRNLLRFTIRIDAVSAVLAIGLALAAAPCAARWFNWEDDVLRLVRIYAVAVPFLMGATPTGILRLFGKFNTLSMQMTIMPVVRFLGSIAAAAVGGVEAFLVVWIISAFANGVSLWVLGWNELRQRDLTPVLLGKSTARADPAWMPFMVKTNGVSTLDLVNESVPVLLVGGIAGNAAAGFFQLAQNVTNLLAHPTNMLNHATFPELAKVEAEEGRHRMVAVALKSAMLATAVAAPFIALFVIFRREIAVLVGGPAFQVAGAIIAGMALYQLVRIVTVVFESATVARGKAGAALIAQSLGAVGLVVSMALLLPVMGVVAAALALAIGRLLMLGVLGIAVTRP